MVKALLHPTSLPTPPCGELCTAQLTHCRTLCGPQEGKIWKLLHEAIQRPSTRVTGRLSLLARPRKRHQFGPKERNPWMSNISQPWKHWSYKTKLPLSRKLLRKPRGYQADPSLWTLPNQKGPLLTLRLLLTPFSEKSGVQSSMRTRKNRALRKPMP